MEERFGYQAELEENEELRGEEQETLAQEEVIEDDDKDFVILPCKNYAFISYSHKDAKIARWLQHKLEQYIIPSNIYEIVDEENLPPSGGRNFRPIFMDETDLTTGLLKETLRENLAAAKYLILICSPNSAKSEWVNKEVELFVRSGRLKQIIPFIIDGTPYLDKQIAAGKSTNGEECMPPFLVQFAKENPDTELLGVDYKANGAEKSAMRIISRMLGVGFDILWNRQARRNRMRFTAFISAIIFIFVVAGYFFMPVKISYTLVHNDRNPFLPLPDDVVLTIEGTPFHLGSVLDTTLILKSRPGYYRGRTLPVEFSATYFDTIRTTIYLGYGFEKHDIIYVNRDKTFAIFAGRVIDDDGEPVEGARVAIQQNETRTDKDGQFVILLPPEDQAETQAIVIDRAGYHDIWRPDECPSDNLTYIMHPLENQGCCECPHWVISTSCILKYRFE